MSETDQEPKRSWSIKQIFLILDEASGISDKAINILTGALTEKDNRMLMMSQPTRPSGYFYDSHGFVNGMVASHLLCHSGTINRHSLNGG